MAVLTPVCAWCRRLLDADKQPIGPRVELKPNQTHGICRLCLAEMREDLDAPPDAMPLYTQKLANEITKAHCNQYLHHEIRALGEENRRLRAMRSYFVRRR